MLELPVPVVLCSCPEGCFILANSADSGEESDFFHRCLHHV